MIGEAQGKRLPLVAVLLAVIMLISGWAVIEDGDDEQFPLSRCCTAGV